MAIIAFFLSPLGRFVGIAILAAALIGSIYMKGYSDGSAHVQGKWDAARAAALKAGNDARSGAERDVDNGVRDSRDTDR